MMKSIKENLSGKSETVLTELNDCFKVVLATLVPSHRGIYITDYKVQCCLQLDCLLPKEVTCTRMAISIEPCKEDKTEKKTPVKSYKTDLSVNGSVSSQTNSPRRSASDVGESEPSALVSR